jgi:hypothetical protein
MEDQHNSPEAFDRMTPLGQATLRLWIRLALQPSRTIQGGDCNFSYGLKHRAEEALGLYIGNGEMKGRARCPLDGKYVGIAYGRAPALCQATPAELAQFERMCAALWDETIARQAALHEQARHPA